MQINFKLKRRLWDGAFRVLIMGCTLLYITSDLTYAKANDATIPVTYVKNVSDAYPLFIHVKGNAKISVGNDILHNETGTYVLPVDESITITFHDIRGSTIKSIILNNENVIDQVQENRLVVNGEEMSQTLIIEFQNTMSRSGANTGDRTNRSMYWTLIIVSIGSSSYIYGIRKKKEEEDNGKK